MSKPRLITIMLILATAFIGGCEQRSNMDEQTILDQNLATAEGMIDAFYSFDAQRLGTFLVHAEKSAKAILYYQGWAEGGNYKVIKRGVCAPDSDQKISCPITVQDDAVMALKTGFMVTDTFTLTFDGTNIIEVETSSNDQPIYYEAREWVAENMPEVMSGPCKTFEDGGGPTPGDCARAMTEGYHQFILARNTN